MEKWRKERFIETQEKDEDKEEEEEKTESAK